MNRAKLAYIKSAVHAGKYDAPVRLVGEALRQKLATKEFVKSQHLKG